MLMDNGRCLRVDAIYPHFELVEKDAIPNTQYGRSIFIVFWGWPPNVFTQYIQIEPYITIFFLFKLLG